MALGGIYETGTVTIAGDRVSVTGVGTLWTPIVEIGDWLFIGGQVGLIGAIVDDTHLTLESQWQGTLPAAAVYVIVKMSWLRYDPALTQSKVRQLLEELNEQGNFVFTSTDPPDPAAGENGQWALKTDASPWKLWYKVDGVWVQQAPPAGIRWRGAWSAATTYETADGVQRLGSSYIARQSNTNQPPELNADDWDLMAAKGDTGATGTPGTPGLNWRGNWSSGATYAVNDGVAQAGASYICVIAHGPTGTPPPTANWNTLAAAGTAIIGDNSIDPIKLNVDAGATETIGFHDRLHSIAYDQVQALSAAQQEQARKNVYAAPLDALAYNGMQINGGMEVSQAFAPAGLTLVNGVTSYTVDGWTVVYGHVAATAVIQVHQMAGAATGAIGLGLYPYTLRITSVVAMSALVNNDVCYIRQKIEGYRVARLGWGEAGAQPISVGFWMYSAIAGVAAVRFFNAAANRLYYKEITVPAGVWAWHPMTIPGDTTGTWEKGNLAGLTIDIIIAGKATTPVVPNVWGTNAAGQTTNSTNLLSSNTNVVYLTGFVVMPGTELPSATAPVNFMRPFDSELLLCQRYLQFSRFYDGVWVGDGNAYVISRPLRPLMRATPTVTLVDHGSVGMTGGYPQAGGADTNVVYLLVAGAGPKALNVNGTAKTDARL